jgi:4a-hydroxytetrahydrobiopterin dehydratase
MAAMSCAFMGRKKAMWAQCVLRDASMKVQKLTDSQVRVGLQGLPGWVRHNDKLHREYKFGDFSDAFGFMVTAALVAQKQDHHPEWSNVFNRVVVDLTTHDAGGISALDFALAKEIERAARQTAIV